MNRINFASAWCLAFFVPACSQPASSTVVVQAPRMPSAGSDAPVRVTDKVSYVLEDGEARHAEHPDTFWIPEGAARESLQKDDIVKLMFQIRLPDKTQTERMWVVVTEKTANGYLGTLDNDPQCTDDLKAGLTVTFEPRHVIQIYSDDKPE